MIKHQTLTGHTAMGETRRLQTFVPSPWIG